MDKQAVKTRKEELSSRLESARNELARSGFSLPQKIKPAHLIRQSIAKKPLPWFLSSLTLATFLGLLLRRPTCRAVKKTGFLGSAFGMGFSLAKPMLTKWVLEKVQAEVISRLKSSSAKSKLGERS